jgi:hypothetical protein
MVPRRVQQNTFFLESGDNYSSTQPAPRDPIHDDDFPPEP